MEIQIFFIHFSYIQMIAEFNSYMSNIDIDFFKELCLKHGELRHYKKNEFILHEGDACSFFGFILSCLLYTSTYFAGLLQKVEWQIQEYEDTAMDTLTLCRLCVDLSLIHI